jgi:hypothetical protein
VVVSVNEFVVSLFISNRVTGDPARGHVHLRGELHDPTIAALSTSYRRDVSRRLAGRSLSRPRPGVPPALSHGTPVVELRGCTSDYGALRAVDALDLAVLEGEFLSLLGPSAAARPPR